MQRIYKGTDIDTETDLSIIAYVYFKYNFFCIQWQFQSSIERVANQIPARTHTH